MRSVFWVVLLWAAPHTAFAQSDSPPPQTGPPIRFDFSGVLSPPSEAGPPMIQTGGPVRFDFSGILAQEGAASTDVVAGGPLRFDFSGLLAPDSEQTAGPNLPPPPSGDPGAMPPPPSDAGQTASTSSGGPPQMGNAPPGGPQTNLPPPGNAGAPPPGTPNQDAPGGTQQQPRILPPPPAPPSFAPPTQTMPTGTAPAPTTPPPRTELPQPPQNLPGATPQNNPWSARSAASGPVISGLRFDGKCIKPGTRLVVSGSGFGSKGKMLLAISYRGRALGPVQTGKWSDGRILAVVPANRRMRADGRTPYHVALTDRRYRVLVQSKTSFTLCK